MDSTRLHKVSRLLQKDLGDIFQREASIYTPGSMVTVTKVNVTKDLAIAKVYLSIFATSDKIKMFENIKLHSREIRYKLGQKIGKQVRVIPELHFFIDDSLDYIENIEKLLDND
ncbi:MAG: 30S ribosome-binding factor RbfA [Bacteroidales bacterium]|nr:30S ribosome-binding factor RbfA [Bacteroidales bacterium]